MTRARILLGSTNHIGCDVDIIWAVFPGRFACGVSRYNIGVKLKRKNLKKAVLKFLKCIYLLQDTRQTSTAVQSSPSGSKCLQQ
jgi:hypothetical protein